MFPLVLPNRTVHFYIYVMAVSDPGCPSRIRIYPV